MSRWFRFHADALNNPKVQKLDGETFKRWVNLLCIACQSDGALPTVDDIAFSLRIPVEEADGLIDRLVTARLLDESQETGLRPHDWDAHQYISDSSAARTKKYRSRRHGDGDVTSQGRHSDVTVTPPEQIQNRTEAEQTQKPSRAESPKVPLPFTNERWRRDEQYVRFVADYLGTGAALIDADFSKAYELCWKTLDIGQKLERVASLNRHAEEYHAEPRYVPHPLKFLESEWARPLKPKARDSPARGERVRPLARAPSEPSAAEEIEAMRELIASPNESPEAKQVYRQRLTDMGEPCGA